MWDKTQVFPAQEDVKRIVIQISHGVKDDMSLQVTFSEAMAREMLQQLDLAMDNGGIANIAIQTGGYGIIIAEPLYRSIYDTIEQQMLEDLPGVGTLVSGDCPGNASLHGNRVSVVRRWMGRAVQWLLWRL